MTAKAKASEHDLRERMQQIREREEKVIAADWMIVPVLEHASIIHAGDYSGEGEPDLIIEVCSPTHKDDAEFIAHARADIPWLLTQLAAILEENHRFAKELEQYKENRRIGTCVDCGASIWFREARIEDATGTYHPVCRVAKRAEAAEAKLGKMREALETIAAWPFDIRGDCVKDATDLARAALAE